MKKPISYILQACLLLVLLLGVALPAGAYTDQKPRDITISISLMDAVPGLMGGYQFAAPSAGRTYAKNEIICAIASMHVPQNNNPLEAGLDRLLLQVEGGTLLIADNFPGGLDAFPQITISQNAPQNAFVSFFRQQSSESIVIHLDEVRSSDGATKQLDTLFCNTTQDETYAFAFFFQMTDATARVRATLTSKAPAVGGENPHVGTLLLPNGYAITRDTSPLNMHERLFINKTIYTVEELTGLGAKAHIIANGATDEVEELLICYAYAPSKSAEYRAVMVRGRLYFFAERAYLHGDIPNIAHANGTFQQQQAFLLLNGIYETLVRDTFGLDWAQRAHTLDSYFGETILHANDITDFVVARAAR